MKFNSIITGILRGGEFNLNLAHVLEKASLKSHRRLGVFLLISTMVPGRSGGLW